MKNGKGEHDFDSIVALLRHQNAVLEVLLHHLAHAEAMLVALMTQTLPNKNLRTAKAMKDYMQSKIYSGMYSDVARAVAELIHDRGQ